MDDRHPLTCALRFQGEWWSQTGSNRRPHACKARALPAELWPPPSPRLRRGKPRSTPPGVKPLPGLPSQSTQRERRVVGLGRFELPTSRLSSARSNQLSYRPGKRGCVPFTGCVHEKKEKRRRRRPAFISETPALIGSESRAHCSKMEPIWWTPKSGFRHEAKSAMKALP